MINAKKAVKTAALLAAVASFTHNAPIYSADQVSPVKKVGAAVNVAAEKKDAQKKLKSKQMILLDQVLAQWPICTVRMKFGERSVSKVKNSIAKRLESKDKSDERKFIKDQLEMVIKPVKQFFEVIKDNKNMVLPVVIESLAEFSPQTRSALVKKPEDSVLYKFFIDTSNDLDKFRDKEIKNIEDLNNFCTDIKTVFGSILSSMSERSKKAYTEQVAKIHAHKKAKATK